MRVVVWAAVVVCLSVGNAGASKQVARVAYAEGKRLYDIGDYKEALGAFKRAYLNFEDASFLYNIGQCHRLLGHREEAVRAYRAFLRNKPESPNADEVRKLIAALEVAIRDDDKARNAQPQDMRPPEAIGTATTDEPTRAEASPSTPTAAVVVDSKVAAPTPLYKRWWLWTTVGVVAVGVGLGVGLGIGLQSDSRFSSTTTLPEIKLQGLRF